MLMMRQNVSSYTHFVNYFAPGIVSVKVWGDFKASKAKYENGNDILDEFFTTSDEAFMLVVLLNYEERWKAELQMKTLTTMVRLTTTLIVCIVVTRRLLTC